MLQKYSSMLIFAVYLIPFASLAMYEDLKWGTLYLYLVLFLVQGFMAALTYKLKKSHLVITGNILHFISSVLFIQLTVLNQESWYFSPLTPVTLALVVALLSWVIQAAIVWSFQKADKRKTMVNGL